MPAAADEDAAVDQGSTDDDSRNNEFGLWLGWNRFGMSDFNGYIESDGFSGIDGGLDVGMEFSPLRVPLPKIKNISVSFLPMILVEFLNAESQRTRFPRQVWKLPILGFVFAPKLEFENEGKLTWLSIRPIGLGYYTLGGLADASLTSEDRIGKLRLKGNAIGILSQVQIALPGFTNLGAAIGFRWLKFTDITHDPDDGWKDIVDPGTPFPHDLDYTGIVFRIGVVTELF